ncbi:hypothetical protein K470DRAFT_256139 [Piedraia hortae CBS 480.64]|uniref:Histone H1 n=1 Tax=Piedraia hortae CBS 480.64 TaxID=1314780 RepID=A0A6A7C4H1_9PEZI|nr:hypothetical protein K470DRAFT_256139 [Piedraia hortae CBS 480.64]
MPPKKTSTGTTSAKKAPDHPTYSEMIKEAIINLKDRSGSSRQAIKKYILANHRLDNVSDTQFSNLFNRALQKGAENGTFARPKGPSGPVKLAGPKDADAPKTVKPKAAAAKKATTAAATTTKKVSPATATKKKPTTTAAKKASTTKKAPAKKPAITKKAASTTKKTAAMAPAVEAQKTVQVATTRTGRAVKSLHKVESGRVTKTAAKPVAKKTASVPKKKAEPSTNKKSLVGSAKKAGPSKKLVPAKRASTGKRTSAGRKAT